MYTAHIRIVATLFLDGKILENEVFDENRLSAYQSEVIKDRIYS